MTADVSTVEKCNIKKPNPRWYALRHTNRLWCGCFQTLSVGFPGTQINCAGNCFSGQNPNSDALRFTALANGCIWAHLALQWLKRTHHTASSCLIIVGKSIQKPTDVSYTFYIIWMRFNLHTPAFVPQPRLSINCHRGSKLRVYLKIEAPTLLLPLLLFVFLPLLQSLLRWDVALAIGGNFNAQCVVY